MVMDPQAEARIKEGKVVEFARVGLAIDVERGRHRQAVGGDGWRDVDARRSA